MIGDEESKLKALSDIASIDINLDFDKILERILQITCETMNAHSGTIMLVDDETKELRMAAKYGLPEDYIERVYRAAEAAGVPISSSPSGTVLKTGQYYTVKNIFEEPKDKPWLELSRELGFTAQIFTPMKRGMKVIGLLNVYMADEHHFTEEDINFVTIAASQASSVVHNARMCKELKKSIDEVNAYNENLEDNLKKLYNKLYNSEKYLRTIINSSIDGITVVDEHGKFEFANDSFFRIIGWPEEEIIGNYFMKIIPEDMNEFILQQWNNVQEGIPGDFETKIITKSEKIKYVKVLYIITKISGDKKVVSVTKDITDYKKLVSDLKESEEKFRELFENAEDPMYVHDLNGYFTKINRAGAMILGGSEKEIIGTHISKYLTPESYKLSSLRIAKVAAGLPNEQPVPIEVICKDGEHKWGEVRTTLIKDGGRIIGIHGIVRDITEKLKMECKIRESEEKYRDLFENARDTNFIIDIEGYFLKMNRMGLQILRVTEDEIKGSHISEWLTPESYERVKQRLMKRQRGESLDAADIIEVICKNNDHRWAEIKTRVIKKNDKIEIHGIARDITEKRLLEIKLKEYTQKLEQSYKELKESDRIRTEFTSNITHELLTPLTSVKGFVELLNDETMGKINNDQKKSIEIISRNTERLIQLIKELLDAANIEKNLFGMRFGLVSMNSILSKCIQEIYPQATSRHITIIEDIKELPKIWGDEERLAQVISNLLNNAVKFTPHDGIVTVAAYNEPEKIRISITDTGIGIPHDKIFFIFDRFYQADSSTSRKYGGVGLGLSIAKSIIEKHYGSIWAESKGIGTTFHITLPKLREKKGDKDVLN